ncbi:MAG TPA: hypothetical protein VFR47_18260 [Anaerolineales bacterium]|nr:hypothetical protein [Anaerolineales bacterium]
MKPREREKESRDSIALMLLILLLGFICIILSSGWALRFAPSWKLPSSMGSNLNPDSDSLTGVPVNFIEPLDPSILTNPAWFDVFLTPGASFATRVAPTPTPTVTIQSVPPKTNTPVPTLIAPATNTVVTIPTNTQIYFPPPSATVKPKPTTEPPATDPPVTNTPVPTDTPVTLPQAADLQITKTDNATDYEAGGTTTYTIVVSNNGPSNVIGAMVSDAKPTNISSWSWVCMSETGGASGCTPAGSSSSDFSDTIDLPVGSSVVYLVPAIISTGATGPLTNTASVSVPAGYTDPTPGNNSAADTDQLIVANSFPYGQIDTTPDGSTEPIAAGTYVILQLGTPLVVSSPDIDGYDLVYYPDPTLQMDAVILQIGDGRNWHTILNWGDGFPDGNTDINPADCPSESDNCVITPPPTNSPGISIQVDGVVPNGNYPYIRIISPPNPPDTSNDGIVVDAITVLP